MPFLSELISAVKANPISAASVFIAAVALVVGMRSLGVSARAAQNSQRAAEATVLREFLTQYAAPQMHDALRTLRMFKEEEGPLLHYLQRLHSASPDSLNEDDVANADRYVKQHEPKVGQARRHVHFYYKRAWQLRAGA
jgi:hypothetical protein